MIGTVIGTHGDGVLLSAKAADRYPLEWIAARRDLWARVAVDLLREGLPHLADRAEVHVDAWTRVHARAVLGAMQRERTYRAALARAEVRS